MGGHPVVLHFISGALGWITRRLVCGLFLVSMKEPVADIRVKLIY
jgi:hypothetical protein